MWNPLILGQLHPLGVNEHHPHLVRSSSHHDRGNEGVNETRFTGTSGTSDQQMGHLGHVGDNKSALDILTQADDQRIVIIAGLRGAQHIAQGDDLLVPVWNLNTDSGFSRNRRQDTHVGRSNSVSDILTQGGDLLHLDGRTKLDLVSRDRRATGIASHLGIDTKFVENR